MKPENIFLTEEYNIKIGDFGVSKQLKNINEYAQTYTGTIVYMAPELINDKKKYNNKVDSWSLGCILYELCTLNYCFDGSSYEEIKKKINRGIYDEINENYYGIHMINLIKYILNVD